MWHIHIHSFASTTHPLIAFVGVCLSVIAVSPESDTLLASWTSTSIPASFSPKSSKFSSEPLMMGAELVRPGLPMVLGEGRGDEKREIKV